MIAALLAVTALPPGPVDFAAQQMRIEKQRVFLDGQVKLVRGDMTVTGDHAVMDYAAQKQKEKRAASKKRKEEPKVGGQAVERFVVTGNVHVQRAARTAEGEVGDVNLVQQTMVLTGTPQVPPVVRDGDETLSGDRILMHLDSDDVDVQRPHVVLRRAIEEQKAVPLRIESQTLDVKKAQQVAHFHGSVVMKREDMTVKAPRMDALYDKDGQLTKLELRGGVDLREGARRATGQNADYDAKTHVVVLTGDPHLWDRGDALTGDRIDMAMDTKEVRIERVRGRVRPEVHKDEMVEAPK